MYNFIYGILNSEMVAIIDRLLTLILFIIFLCYFFSKEGRDERGRNIIGTASFYSSISLLISLNIFGLYSNTVMSNIIVLTNATCWVYLVFEIVQLVSIAILRRKKNM